MRPTKLASFTIFLFFLGTLSYAEVADKVVAVINSDVITQSDLDRDLALIYAQYGTIYQGSELALMLEEARHERLAQMIEDRLILQEAKRRQIEVTDEELGEKVARIKSKFAQDSEFMDALNEGGLTLTDLKAKYREQIMVAKLINQEVRARINISPQEVSDYYRSHLAEFSQPERVRVRNILIRVEGDNEEDWARAHSKVEELLDRLKRGSRFEDLARESSQGPNADTGGDMGLIERGQMLAEIDEVIFELEVGEVSGLIKTELGYHIFKVEEKLEPDTQELAEVREEIEQVIFKEKFDQRFREWMDGLKADAYISIK